jgi:hypothetical protein
VEAPRSNIRAGILSLAAVAAFSGCIWAMNAWKQMSMADYTVRFTREQGVYGIKQGSPILIGGLVHGRVVDVRRTDAGYEANIRIDADVPLYRQVQVWASGAGINGESTIEINDTGRRMTMLSPNAAPSEAGLLPPGSSIVAVDPPAYRAFVGNSTAQPLQWLVRTWFPDDPADSLTSRLKSISDELPKQGRELKKGFDGLTERAGPDFRKWKIDFEALRDAGKSAFAKLGVERDAPPGALVPQMRAITQDASELKRPDTARANIAAEAFDRAIASARSLGAKVGSLRSMLGEPDTSMGRAAADFSIASQELSATEREAVTSPWRLAGGPAPLQRAERDRAELVRAYAQAATQYQRAMKGIEDALRRDEPLLAQDPALAELLRSRFEAANALFDRWQGPMEDLLLGTTAHPGPAAPPGPPTAPAAP